MTAPGDRGYEYVRSERALGVHAWAPTEAEAFAEAALGVLALGVAPADVADVDHREVRAQGASPDALLVNWVNECLYVHELEGFAVHGVEVDVCERALVHGLLRGEPIDPARHQVAAGTKAARLAGTRVCTSAAGCEVTVFVDG